MDSIEIVRLPQADLDEMLFILEEYYDPEPCRLDHHGYCQEHNWFGKGLCLNVRIRNILLRYRPLFLGE